MVTVSSGREFNFSFAFNDSDFSDRILLLEIIPDEGGAKVTTLHISSIVLAEKSPFFYKMFKNGMKESQNKNKFSLRINASEEAALMELFRFMYGETALNSTSFDDLVGLLIIADKFEVTSCMVHCVEMLQKFPMSLESALAYFELPSSVLVSEIVKPLIDAAKQCVLELPMSLEHAIFYLELPSRVLVSEIVKPLTDAAKQFVAAAYKDFTRSQEEAMQLPLCAIEAVLGSIGLQVVSEDDVFDFVLKWARASYPELDERRGILTNHLVQLICFPNMSVAKLKEILACPDFDYDHVSKYVHEALFSKIKLSCGQFLYDPNINDIPTTQCRSIGRVYSPHCVVFFDIIKGVCASLFPRGTLKSPKFRLGGKLFYLLAHCGHQKDRFGLCVMRMENLKSFTLDFEFAVMKKSSMEFESKYKVNNHTLEVGGWGLPNLLDITWTELMSDDSDYFIDGVLHFKAELTLKT